jgi:hypothetical protein
MPQQLLNLLSVTPLQENWDASLEAAVNSLKAALRTFNMSIKVHGSHTTPSQVAIQLQNAVGDDLNEQIYVRIRVTDAAGSLYLDAAYATLGIVTGTLAETTTAGKDLTIQSNSSGLIVVQITDTTAETFTVLLGPPSMCAPFANFNNSLAVTHA